MPADREDELKLPQSSVYPGVPPEIDSETIESYVSMIGNHTILVNLTNNLVTNDVYDKKLIEYKKETIQITKGNDDISVTNYDEWNANSIESRQKALGKHAEEIWSM